MTPHVPLFGLGTNAHTERLRNVMSRLCGRQVKLTEDATAVSTEALEAVANRLDALERAASGRHKGDI